MIIKVGDHFTRFRCLSTLSSMIYESLELGEVQNSVVAIGRMFLSASQAEKISFPVLMTSICVTVSADVEQ